MANDTKHIDIFLRGIFKENPVFVMLLGMCPVLAVTNSVINALAMGIATLFVLICSNVLVALFKNLIPKQVRIATYIIIIATFVTVVDYLIQAISYDLYKALGAFIQLIVVNCMILGRAEAFASRHSVKDSFFDALGMGCGFTVALLCLGTVREVLGNGTLLDGTPLVITLFGENFQPWAIMMMPPGAFFVLAGWLLLFSWWQGRQLRKAKLIKMEGGHDGF